MPIKANAKKELRKSVKRSEVNKVIKASTKTLVKKTRQAIDAKNGEAKDLLKQSIKALDKAAQKGVIKKGTADRKKSRLMKKLNKLSSEKK